MKLLFEQNKDGILKLVGRAYGSYRTSNSDRVIYEATEDEVVSLLDSNLSESVEGIRGFEGYVAYDENEGIFFDESYVPKDSSGGQ